MCIPKMAKIKEPCIGNAKIVNVRVALLTSNMNRVVSGKTLLSVSIFFVSTSTWLHFTFLERSIFTDHRIVKVFNVNPILFKQ